MDLEHEEYRPKKNKRRNLIHQVKRRKELQAHTSEELEPVFYSGESEKMLEMQQQTQGIL